jgi:hypothetical protein
VIEIRCAWCEEIARVEPRELGDQLTCHECSTTVALDLEPVDELAAAA